MMQSLLYQFLSVYAVGILGYHEHPRSPKYAPILNVNLLTGIDQEGGKRDSNESSNLLSGIN